MDRRGLLREGLTKRFGELVALGDCSFAVEPGRVVGLLGPNGAGKTTAMRCIFGPVQPDAGVVRWDDPPVDGRTAPALRIHAGGARLTAVREAIARSRCGR
jgi:ABC-type multidrug transport system ATPase subunit